MTNNQSWLDMSYFTEAPEIPVNERRDPMMIGALTASRIRSLPSDAIRRWAQSATIIEIETGRHYYISGGADWFEIHDGVVFTVPLAARVSWAEGTADLGVGMWLVCMA